jgi:protein-S-isoprenylcysteine O-methyltransferase Ste14
MLTKNSKNILFLLLSLIFSAALMFAFIELPVLIDGLLNSSFGFPGFDQGFSELNSYKADLFISEFHLRLIGYISLALILLFIMLGFITKKSGWAWIGAFGLFLPVFGQFALSMFFLSGLSVLRVIWLPFMDISFDILSLGNIVYLPHNILIWFFGLFNWNAHSFLMYFYMGLGCFLFVWGVMVWFQTRFDKKGVAENFIYKISRHPQYLGWIIWSYGLMLFSSGFNQMKKTWTVPSSLPWLIAVMVIIAICLIEEIRMKELYKDEYEKYRGKTPFLFPIPSWLKSILKSPLKLIFKKEHPERKSEVIGITSFYTIILIVLSLFWVDFKTEPANPPSTAISNPQQTIDSLVTEIKTTHRRDMHKPFGELARLGNAAEKPMIELLSDYNPDIREFSAEYLGKLKSNSAVDKLILMLEDSEYRVARQAAASLGQIGDRRAEAPLISMLDRPIIPGLRNAVIGALSAFKSEAVWPLLVEGTKDPAWYNRTGALASMYQNSPEKTIPYLIAALEDENVNVRRGVVNLILENKISQTAEALIKILNDEDFETRFYAKQALKIFRQLN